MRNDYVNNPRLVRSCNVLLVFRLRGPLNVELVEESLDEIARTMR